MYVFLIQKRHGMSENCIPDDDVYMYLPGTDITMFFGVVDAVKN